MPARMHPCNQYFDLFLGILESIGLFRFSVIDCPPRVYIQKNTVAQKIPVFFRPGLPVFFTILRSLPILTGEKGGIRRVAGGASRLAGPALMPVRLALTLRAAGPARQMTVGSVTPVPASESQQLPARLPLRPQAGRCRNLHCQTPSPISPLACRDGWHRARCTARTVMSAGVMPLIRSAWPSEAGRISASLSRASARRCEIAA